MIFSWLRNRRRRRIVAQPFPSEWQDIMAANARHVFHLTDDQQQRVRKFVQIFVAEKNWEGCNGFAVSDQSKVTIAAQAALLALGDHVHYFDHVLSILIYPEEFVTRDRDTNSDGVVTERNTTMLGEAVWQGPVVLSWEDVLAGGRRTDRGHNLVLHEFAHQLDMMNGRHVDGIPPLQTAAQLQRWLKVMQPEYQQLRADCRRRQASVIDCYGSQNEAEFFAVLVEAFFEKSIMLRRQHAAVYQLLADYFQTDPASWHSD